MGIVNGGVPEPFKGDYPDGGSVVAIREGEPSYVVTEHDEGILRVWSLNATPDDKFRYVPIDATNMDEDEKDRAYLIAIRILEQPVFVNRKQRRAKAKRVVH